MSYARKGWINTTIILKLRNLERWISLLFARFALKTPQLLSNLLSKVLSKMSLFQCAYHRKTGAYKTQKRHPLEVPFETVHDLAAS